MLLRNLVDSFIVINSDVEEINFPGEKPESYVIRVAEEKALEAGKKFPQSGLTDVCVIGADTIVVDHNEILGKPKNRDDAQRILEQLRGKTHQVLSGISILQLSTNKVTSNLVRTVVEMRKYSANEIQEYIESGDPFDKAGAYAIQNKSFHPVLDYTDCYANVMGLPLCHLAVLLKGIGVRGNRSVAERCQKSIQYQCPVYEGILLSVYGQLTES